MISGSSEEQALYEELQRERRDDVVATIAEPPSQRDGGAVPNEPMSPPIASKQPPRRTEPEAGIAVTWPAFQLPMFERSSPNRRSKIGHGESINGSHRQNLRPKEDAQRADQAGAAREEILLTKQRDRLFKKIETISDAQAEDLPAGRDAEIARAAQGAGPGL